MIHTKNNRVSQLPILRRGKINNIKTRLETLFGKSGSLEFTQARASDYINDFDYEELLGHLEDFFFNKCAFCETKTVLEIGRYRPVGDAAGKGGTLRHGYWWIAFEGFNLFPICRTCEHSKGVLFPILERRGKHPQKHRALLAEAPLLLDPGYDEPSNFLEFYDTGKVSAAGSSPNQKRGATTIEILNLNRPTLVKARLDAGKKFQTKLKGVLGEFKGVKPQGFQADHFIKTLADLVDPTHEYCAVQRSLLLSTLHKENFIDALGEHELKLIFGSKFSLRKNSDENVPLDRVEIRETPRLQSDTPNFDHITSTKEVFSVKGNMQIRRVKIRNFKCIEDLDLDLARTPEEILKEVQTPWLVLLGENSVGKSSILQAIGLALMDHRERLNILPERRDCEGLLRKNAKEGFVRLETNKSDEEIGFKLSKSSNGLVSIAFLKDVVHEGTVIRGFGAIRICEGSVRKHHKKQQSDDTRAEISNLFDPHFELRDPNSFAAEASELQWNNAVRTLRDFLPVEPTQQDFLIRKGKQIYLCSGDEKKNFRELSDGYRGILMMAVDIMAGIPADYTDMRHATGIIIIDEIGTHLHPRWKMEIVGLFRKSFPQMQFIVTTHEPLCLRGIQKDETVVMLRDSKENLEILREQLPSPSALRVDQILTSDHFGLSSTIDPDLDREFQEYYLLKSKQNLTNDELKLLEALRAKLQSEGAFSSVLGYTRRDQIIYEFIDSQIIKENNAEGFHAKQEIRSETKKKLAEIWQHVLASETDDQSQ